MRYPSEMPHWGRVTHICVSKLTTIGSDNGLSPGRRQAIIWTNAGILLIRPVGTNFSEILIEIQTVSLKKIRLKMSSAKWCQFRLGLNVLKSHQVSFTHDLFGSCPIVFTFCTEHSSIIQNFKTIEQLKLMLWASMISGDLSLRWHYNDVIMNAMASQIISLTTVFSTVYSDVNQRKHQSSIFLAFVWGIHRWPVNSPHKRPVTLKKIPFDDVTMVSDSPRECIEQPPGLQLSN